MKIVLDSRIRFIAQDLEPYWEDLEPLLHIDGDNGVIALWQMDESILSVPRGLREPLINGFDALGVSIEGSDFRTSQIASKYVSAFDSYRSFQEKAAQRAINAEEGIIESPAGSGKSVCGLEIIRRANQEHNLVLVHEIGIARQWIEEARKFLGEDFGYGVIGNGSWNEDRLTLCTYQTLYSRRDELDKWFDKWGLIIVDECHRVQARTFFSVVDRFPAKYRFGLSATPDKTGDFEVCQAILGDVIHRTTRHELRDEGILVKPTINVVRTKFNTSFWPDHTATKKDNFKCLKPNCSLSGKRRHAHRNNYAAVLKKLVEDRNRNNQIAQKIISRQNHPQIVASKQVKQLKFIERSLLELGYEGEILWLIGEIEEKERLEVKNKIKPNKDLVLLTTIADEAFDSPPLDTLHLVFPTKNPGTIRQRIGRIERALEEKKETQVYDYLDEKVGVFNNQYRSRKLNVYNLERYRIVDI